jgi:hypothetical protein
MSEILISLVDVKHQLINQSINQILNFFSGVYHGYAVNAI